MSKSNCDQTQKRNAVIPAPVRYTTRSLLRLFWRNLRGRSQVTAVGNASIAEPSTGECCQFSRLSQPKPTIVTGLGKQEQPSQDSSDEEESEEDYDFDVDDELEDDRSEYEEYAEFPWLEAIDGFVYLKKDPAGPSKSKIIGSCNALLIRRAAIRGSFYSDMEEPSDETSKLAFTLFDRYGWLRSEWKDHPHQRGTAAFQDELGKGDMYLLDRLVIDPSYRRQGLGKRVTMALLEKARSKIDRPFFTFVRPGFLRIVMDEQRFHGKSENEKQSILFQDQDNAVAFYRALGFRRIGSSSWLGLASSSDHPSRLIPSHCDFDRQVQDRPFPEGESQALLKTLASDLDDSTALAQLQDLDVKNPNDDQVWLATDDKGNTPLHIAAIRYKSQSVDCILAEPVGFQMQPRRNDDGHTPLEALLSRLEVLRTQKEVGFAIAHVSDSFVGYCKKALQCVARLKGVTASTPLEFSRLKYGCTCEQCWHGILSPRMIQALKEQADLIHSILLDDLSDGRLWVEMNGDYLIHLLQPVRENLKTNKSMRQGFVNLCEYFGDCLDSKVLPTETNILDKYDESGEWPPCTKNFLQRGGTVASVASTLFLQAMDSDESIGGAMWDEDDGPGSEENQEQLPRCRNDKEYGFVSGMLGSSRVSSTTFRDLGSGRVFYEGDQ